MAPKKFEVVISGISGVFPECDSLDELEMKLMNKENVITVDDRRWTPGKNILSSLYWGFEAEEIQIV